MQPNFSKISTHRHKLLLWLLLAIFAPLLPVAAQDGRRIGLAPTGTPQNNRRLALVIGNAAYKNVASLKNPVNDANDMAAALKNLGFEVILGTNLEQSEMKRLIREFGQKLKTGGTGLFYYAGHGVQVQGNNYLVPVGAEVAAEAEIEDTGVNLNLVLRFMDEAGNDLNMVVLDACRNNPFARSVRSAADGLAQVDAPTGTLIAYSTSPGKVANDGANRNGTYTEALLKQMRVPNLNVLDMFQEVRAQVRQQTGGKQTPWESSSLVGRFYFAGNVVATPPAPNVAAPSTKPNAPAGVSEEQRRAEEKAFWESALKFDDAALYQEYLDKTAAREFTGLYANLARTRLNQLRQAKNTPPENPPAVPNKQTAGRPPLKNQANDKGNTPGAQPAGLTTTRNTFGMDFVTLPAGSFTMGAASSLWDDERPARLVRVAAFAMGQTEVTQAQWVAVMGNNPSSTRGDNLPVTNVSWYDAQEFIKRLNEKAADGVTYRLPTEAEWEYAARAGNQDDDVALYLKDAAWYNGNSGERVHAVGEKKPNDFGLYDMQGNVAEWVQDAYQEGYRGLSNDAAVAAETGEGRVFRGCSFRFDGQHCRAPRRNFGSPNFRDDDKGLRLVAVRNGNSNRQLGVGKQTAAPVRSVPEPAPATADIVGNWLVRMNLYGNFVDAAAGFRLQNGGYIGLWILPNQVNGVARNITVRGNVLEADMCDATSCSRLRAVVQGDNFSGTLTQAGYPVVPIVGTRVSRE